ncbi:glycosyltransferase [Candidatus Saccharibacteria bacterium]|nr:glycosyltransferase [Candidatus Saccharibacteria bacterium]
MKKNIVSIIVPIYNSEDFLERCLDSIMAQTYANIEVILVDDGSVDESFAICKVYEKKDVRFKAIKKCNNGVSSARNYGLKLASGDYVCFFDSDDVVEPNMVERLLDNLLRHEADLSMCGYNIIDNCRVSEKKQKIASFLMLSKEDFHRNYRVYQGYLWNKMFKTDIAKKVLFDEDIYCCEDELFVVRYVEYCAVFYYDNELLYNYYIDVAKSFDIKNEDDKRITQIEAKRRELDVLEKYGFSVYKDYYTGFFLAINDISHKCSRRVVDKRIVDKMYKTLLCSDEVGLSLKISLYIKYRFFWLYDGGKRFLKHLKR